MGVSQAFRGTGTGPAADSWLLPDPAVAPITLSLAMSLHRGPVWENDLDKTIKKSELVLIPVRFPAWFIAQVLGQCKPKGHSSSSSTALSQQLPEKLISTRKALIRPSACVLPGVWDILPATGLAQCSKLIPCLEQRML